MAKIRVGRLIISAIIYAILAQIVHSLGAFATMKYYLMEQYLTVWSKVMMPVAGPPPTSFMIYSIAFSLITGLLLTIVYCTISNGLPSSNVFKRGLIYGFMLFLIAGIPMALSLYLLVNLPIALIISWTVESLIIYVFSGIIIAKLNK